jgi:hypothetical protein
MVNVMGQTDAERARRYRDRKRGGPPRELRPHGTRAAVRRHERAGEKYWQEGEDFCQECRDFERARQQELYASRKAVRRLLNEVAGEG